METLHYKTLRELGFGENKEDSNACITLDKPFWPRNCVKNERA